MHALATLRREQRHDAVAGGNASDPAAHLLNDPSANALLKTLEEPPPRTQFVLVTTNGAALLTTIRSRCQRVQFRALDDQLVARRLIGGHGVLDLGYVQRLTELLENRGTDFHARIVSGARMRAPAGR